jgi:tRNA (mo5U34)-methyltransferase
MTGTRTRRRRRIEALGPWFHNLHLPDGTQTVPEHPLGDFPSYKWEHLAPRLPARMDGWRALDIGCNAGYYTFELAKRGAEVVGIDVDARYLAQARWAAREYGLTDRVTFRQMQVYDLARRAETFDLVLFMGVFYHLRHPLLALEVVAPLARRLLVFQTLTLPGMETVHDTGDRAIMDRADLLEPGWPKMAFVEHRFAGDPTNWWIPNHAGVEAMLRSVGLEVVERPGHEIYLCAPAPADDAPEALEAERRSALAARAIVSSREPGARGTS